MSGRRDHCRVFYPLLAIKKKTVIPALACLLLMVLLGLQVYAGHRDFENAIVEQTRQQLLATVQSSANSLEIHINEHFKSLQIMAEDPLLAGNFTKVSFDGPAYRKILGYFSLHNEAIDCISLLDSRGTMLNRVPFWPDKKDRRGLDLSAEPGIAATLSSGKPQISEAYYSRLGTLAISLTAPIYKGDEMTGILRAVISIDRLIDKSIAPIEFGASLPVIFDDHKRFLYHPGISPTTLQCLTGADPSTPDLKTPACDQMDTILGQAKTGGGTTIIKGSNQAGTDSRFFVAFAPVQMQKGFWVAAIVLPYKNIISPITRHSIKSGLFFATLIGVILVFVAMLIRSMEKKKILETEAQYLKQLARSAQELERANKILQEQAIRDGLTGLYNFRYFNKALQNDFMLALRHGADFCCLLIDLDHFKQVNDSHGHPFGDFVLKKFAAQVQEAVRDTDLVARYGGEEFVILLPQTELAGALTFADRLRERIEAFLFFDGQTSCHITISIGVASYHTHHPESPQDLVAFADKALYRAKEDRNRVVYYTESKAAE